MMTPIDTVSSISQLNIFVLSVIIGAVLELIFELFNLFSTSKTIPKALIFFNDVLYFVLAAVITHCFLIYFCDGKIRFFVLLGEFAGFAAIYNSLGRLFRFLLKKSEKILFHIFVSYIKPFLNFLTVRIKSIYPSLKKSKKITKKTQKVVKKT